MKDESPSFGTIVDELVSLSQEGVGWGLRNHFPPIKDYPQYLRIRQLGELIHANAGHEGMQEACRFLKRRVVMCEGGGQYLAEHAWDGIGDWHRNAPWHPAGGKKSKSCPNT